MKKLLALTMALAMSLSLAACGNSGDQNAPGSASSNGSASTSQSDASTSTGDASNAGDASFTTVEEGKLIMATNATFPPYEYIEGGQVAGIDAEIITAVAEKLGLEPVIEDMEFDAVIEAVKGGKADIGLAGMTVTPDRAAEVDFTVSYATGVQVVIVTEDSAITSVDDLFAEGANYVVGVQRNTTGDIYATQDIEDAGLGTIDRYSKASDTVQALVSGKVDCVIIDNEPAKAFVSEIDGLKILDTEYITEDYAAAMNKENTALYHAVNTAMQELLDDGTIQSIIDKYITAD